MSPTILAVTILAVAALLVTALLIANANRRKRRVEDVPPAMRPGYSDEELERGVLERSMQWGLVLTVALALFFPLYWLNETPRLNAEAEEFFVEAVLRGEEQYVANCAECHSENLAGGVAPSPYSEEGWPAPALDNIVLRYAENPNIIDIEDFIIQTIQRGRPGTPMPTWGAGYNGPMTDQQISDITSYILANQVAETTTAVAAASDMSGEELYEGNCVKCHGAELQGIVGPSLIGVTERHSPDDILGILRNGIYLPTGTVMPPFSEVAYQYEGARYTEDALERIVEYLEQQQPESLPEDAGLYQTPGLGQAEAIEERQAEGDGGGAAGGQPDDAGSEESETS